MPRPRRLRTRTAEHAPDRDASTAQPDRAVRGAAAEAAAARLLERHGLVILARNYRIRGGEIDLVAADGPTLVFVEVRLRTSTRFGGAAASITGLKQARILRAARHYVLRAPDRPCRFDVVLATSATDLEWIRDAFGDVA